jgi:hypothetical protein
VAAQRKAVEAVFPLARIVLEPFHVRLILYWKRLPLAFLIFPDIMKV